MKKKILKVFLIFAILLSVTAAICIHEVNGYINIHTWATISLGGTRETDTADAFFEEH